MYSLNHTYGILFIARSPIGVCREVDCMNEIYLLLLAIVGVFCCRLQYRTSGLGTMIDRYPVGDESKRERGLASPIESTQYRSDHLLGYCLLSGAGGPAGDTVRPDPWYHHASLRSACSCSPHWHSPLLSSAPCGDERQSDIPGDPSRHTRYECHIAITQVRGKPSSCVPEAVRQSRIPPHALMRC